METINLQAKARPRSGYIEHYWFENPTIGLARTLFHRVVVLCRCGLITWIRMNSSRNPTGVRSPRRRHRPPVAHNHVTPRRGGRVKGDAAAERSEGNP